MLGLIFAIIPDLPDDIVIVDRGVDTVVLFRAGLSSRQRHALAVVHLTAAERASLTGAA